MSLTRVTLELICPILFPFVSFLCFNRLNLIHRLTYLLVLIYVTLQFSLVYTVTPVQALSPQVIPRSNSRQNIVNSQNHFNDYGNTEINHVRADAYANYERKLQNFKEINRKHKNEVQECCANGRQYAINQQRCDSTRSKNDEHLGSVDECSMFWSVCCLEQLMLTQCKYGIDSIKQKKQQCLKLAYNHDSNNSGSLVSFECCSACELGFRWSSWEQSNNETSPCTVPFLRSIQPKSFRLTLAIQSILEETFVDCCNQSKLEAIDFNRNLNDKQEVDEKLPFLAKLTQVETDRSTFCGKGYEYNPSSPTKCTDIDECESGRYECETPNINCINTIGSYYCSRCKAGFRLRTSDELSQYRYDLREKSDCVDVNECLENPCLPGQSCMNVVGSYKCFCQVGYQMDNYTGECYDVNECQLGTHNCHETLRCDNTVGSFHCVRVQDCGTGYTINADRDICEDIDECALGIHDCKEEFQCRNTQGTFKCDRISCPLNQQLIHGMCKNVVCPIGKQFDYMKGQCIYSNPCINNPCSSNERCQALPSSSGSISRYQCITNCQPGFQFENNQCVDIDECTTGLAECVSNQHCVNLQGHYDCVCDPGFVMDSNRTCNDIDECKLEGRGFVVNCSYPFRCSNTIGSYSCNQCYAGYRRTHDGQCIDIDECSEQNEFAMSSNSVCDHICLNTVGSFKCECRLGFRLSHDSRTCVDIDECNELFDNVWKQPTYSNNNYRFSNGIEPLNNASLCVGVCRNTIGSFECNCPDGFRRVNGHCVDINECMENTIACKNEDESCINIIGSSKCIPIKCPVGYKKFIGYKSIQCIKTGDNFGVLGADSFNQYSYLYYSLYNNQTDLRKRPGSTSGYRFYATRFGDSSTSSTNGYGTYFDLKFVSADRLETTYSDFRLEKRSSNEATISIMKPLSGPQTIKLELIIVGYKKNAYYRQKIYFTIDVSKYNSM